MSKTELICAPRVWRKVSIVWLSSFSLLLDYLPRPLSCEAHRAIRFERELQTENIVY
jgi:hypothetical protein